MIPEKPIRRDDIIAKQAGGETLLYSAEMQAIHVLNPTAEQIWQLCDGTHSVADMAQALQEQFDIPADRDVTADVRQTLATFVEKGLLL